MTLKTDILSDLSTHFDTDEHAETITYSKSGQLDRSIPALIERDEDLEDYVRGEETATGKIKVKVSDVPKPEQEDTFTVPNFGDRSRDPRGYTEIWEFRRVTMADRYVMTIECERRLQ